jgi:protein NrfD
MESRHRRACCELPGMQYWRVLWVVLLGLGTVGVVQRLGWGHHYAHYGSYVTWGLWVSAYIYFIGLSAGAFLLSSLVYGFRMRALERVGPIALVTAVITLFLALLSIWFDLGHMERFYYVFIRPNFRSMMAWMVWLYSAYFLLLLGELYLVVFRKASVEAVTVPLGLVDLRRLWRVAGLALIVVLVVLIPLWTTQAHGRGWIQDEGLMAFFALTLGAVVLLVWRLPAPYTLRLLGVLGIPLAVMFHGGVGALFATVAARPYWHSPIQPVLFLTGALVSGGGLLLFVLSFVYPLPDPEKWATLRFLSRIVGGLLALDLLLEWAEFSVPLWYGFGEEVESLRLILFGPYWWVFWVVHLLIGSLIPLGLILWSRRVEGWGLAGLLIAVSFMAVRLNVVIPGLVTPPLRGLQEAFMDRRLQFGYVPSLHEWLVVAFIIALGLGLFYGACRWLHRWEGFRVHREEVEP